MSNDVNLNNQNKNQHNNQNKNQHNNQNKNQDNNQNKNQDNNQNKNKPKKGNGLLIGFIILFVINIYFIVNSLIFGSLENQLKKLYDENQKTYTQIQNLKAILDGQHIEK